MHIATIVIGGLLLLFGRKLFWLYVAASGFAVGLTLATRLFRGQPEWLALLIGLAVGILGALIALLFQRVAIAVGGFLAGAFIAVSIAVRGGFEGDTLFWVTFVLGGVIGAILLVAIFEWALIALSCLSGSSLIVGALGLPRTTAFVVWLGLLVLGLAVQAAMMRRQRG